MATKGEDLLKRPLYVYDLPHEILSTLRPKDTPQTQIQPQRREQPEPSSSSPSRLSSTPVQQNAADSTKTPPGSASCALCGVTFGGTAEQRQHVKSDWHGYNVKQRMRERPSVNEPEFERLLETLDESISGSDSSSSEDGEDEDDGDGTKLSALLKKQAKMKDEPKEGQDDNDGFGKRKRKRGGGGGGPPMVWFSSSALPDNVNLGVYRALFTDSERQQPDVASVLKQKQLEPSTGGRRPVKDDGNGVPLPMSISGPSVFICMIGGGHFASMIVSLTPEVTRVKGVPERQAKTIAQKTFHRYTTRRKQGGAQSLNDNAKGNAHSAGAGIRRANEAALEQDIRSLLREWRDMINRCEVLFVRASGTTNRRILFGAHEGQVLRSDDPRMRSIPFGTRRATQQECMRAFVELTRMKVSHVDLAALAAATEAAKLREEQQKAKASASPAPKEKKGPSPEEEEALLHTSQLQALIRRSKVPALLSYLKNNSVSSDFRFAPLNSQPNHHASTPLHLAASLNSSPVVSALLVKAGADPKVTNGESKVAFDLAGDRATRDAFRVARSELGEARWDWTQAHVPSPLTRTEADQREKEDKAQEAKNEAARRKTEMERLNRETQESVAPQKPAGRVLGSGVEITAADKREQEARGLTPEMRMKLERERRARAADERMRRLTGK